MPYNLKYKTKSTPTKDFLKSTITKPIILINVFFAVIYFVVITFFFTEGNTFLFWLLIGGEVFHMWLLFTFLFTVWEMKETKPFNALYMPEVDIFITVAGEPKSVIEETIIAVKEMNSAKKNIYILNDGFVAKRENWMEAEEVAREHGVNVITRKIPGGAKAGNINNALKKTTSEYIVIFDADHVPYGNFLEKTLPFFSDPSVAFVQSPQFYKNYNLNRVTRGSWEQQELFFGPICKGKNSLNSTTMCGTNMVIRKDALLSVGGMCEESIAEDFATGLFLHQKGFTSVYVPEVLAEGLAPEDFLSYYKQQFRWARGAFDVLFKYNVLFRRGLTLSQRIQYLSSASYFLSSLIVVMNALIPFVYFFTGAVPFLISTMLLAVVFIPYIFLTLYVLQRSTNFSVTFNALAFSMSSFSIHISALWSLLSGKKTTFEITSKKKLEGNFLNLVKAHIFYIALLPVGLTVAIIREGVSASVVANSAWAILNAVIFTEFILAAMPDSFSFSKNFQKK